MRKLWWLLRFAAYAAVLYLAARSIHGWIVDALADERLAYPAMSAFVAFALLAGLPYMRWRTPERRRLRLRRDKPETAAGTDAPAKGRLRLRWVVLPGKRVSVIRTTALLAASLTLAGSALLPEVKRHFTAGFEEDLAALDDYDPAIATRVYSADDELICSFGLENRDMVRLEDIPPYVRDAFISAEDRHFREHRGFDPTAIIRAALANFRSGDIRQGGSTLTQQVVRNLVLHTNERTFERKFREIFLAVELERRMPKDRILEIYLNEVFLGRGAYGIETASRVYFGKSVFQLSLAEAAILAGLPKAPSSDSPYWHPERARARMRYVIGRMLEDGAVTADEADSALAEETSIVWAESELNRASAPYFCDLVRRELKRMFGNEAIFHDGLVVRTTLDMRMQRAAESSVRRNLLDLERRTGWMGPEWRDEGWNGCAGPARGIEDGRMVEARVSSVEGDAVTMCVEGGEMPLHQDDVRRVRRWETRSRRRLAPGDVISVVRPPVEEGQEGGRRHVVIAGRCGGATNPSALQAALVSVDPTNGHLVALVGGYDFGENQFNNATMARRQVGSSIKPYVYLTALMHGMRVDDVIVDRPVCYTGSNGRRWCPRNYVGPTTRDPYMGRVSLRTALAKSLNSVSVQLAHRVGVEEVIRTMRSLGVTSPLQRYLPLAVGTAELTPWEHTFAYASIAAGGREMPRHEGSDLPGIFILSVTDSRGNELFRQEERPQEEWPQAVPSGAAYALTWLMRGVVEEGTGRQVQMLQRPAGGKTGTTNDFKDAWFLGFTPDLVTGVWVGRNRPIRISWEATGGTVALPIWMDYMEVAHPDTPARDFPVPDDVVLTFNSHWQLVPYQRGSMPAEAQVRAPRR